ncbi:hypothetical protein DICPUDRAFT_18682, partial [Dictyostelium purpureum]
DSLKMMGTNSFVFSCWEAYNHHHHLEIRPDDVYMAIMVQFSLYLNKHSEIFRERIVDFQGKQTIEVKTGEPLFNASYGLLINEIVKKMKSKIKDPSLAEWAVPNFSTTTESDKIAFSSVLLSTMKKYYEYSIRSYCGLPSVTLLGTVDDWVDLKHRLQKLKEFNIDNKFEIFNTNKLMDRWVLYLEPIIDQFISTASGNPDLEWWNSIAHYKQRSGGDDLTGWLSCFCCFDNDGEWIANQIKTRKWPDIVFTKIANGYVDTTIKLIDGDETEYTSTLFSGHIATTTSDTKIKPSIDWFLL